MKSSVVHLLIAALLLTGPSCSWLRPPRTEKYIHYRIRPGDTTAKISSRFHATLGDIERLNDVSDVDHIPVGTVIRLPYVEPDRPIETPRASFRFDSRPKVALGRAQQYVGKLRWPVRGGKLTSEFGRRWVNFHEGIDISAKEGKPIYAAHDGMVVYSGRGMRGFGNIVVLRGDGLITVYAHNDVNEVRTGESVEAGEKIAEVGMTGRASGPHLHFETRVQTPEGRFAAVDPQHFLQ